MLDERALFVATGVLSWVCWDVQWLVYDSRSGDTHYLDQVSADALRLLERAPQSPASLTGSLARQLGINNTVEIERQVLTLVEQLLDLGLVDKIAAPH